MFDEGGAVTEVAYARFAVTVPPGNDAWPSVYHRFGEVTHCTLAGEKYYVLVETGATPGGNVKFKVILAPFSHPLALNTAFLLMQRAIEMQHSSYLSQSTNVGKTIDLQQGGGSLYPRNVQAIIASIRGAKKLSEGALTEAIVHRLKGGEGYYLLAFLIALGVTRLLIHPPSDPGARRKAVAFYQNRREQYMKYQGKLSHGLPVSEFVLSRETARSAQITMEKWSQLTEDVLYDEVGAMARGAYRALKMPRPQPPTAPLAQQVPSKPLDMTIVPVKQPRRIDNWAETSSDED